MLKLGMVMDPITQIKTYKDTSFAMLLEAQARNYQLFYMQIQDLFVVDGVAKAIVSPITVKDQTTEWVTIGTSKVIDLAELDVILMRKDPPFDQEYIYATYILELAEQQGCMVVNKPQALRDCNEKLFISYFSQFTPKTLVSRRADLIKQFQAEYHDIILKPLDGMGGTSIFRVKDHDANFNVIIETLTNYGTSQCMVQEYIPAIKDGDKRVLVVDGQVMPYCLARIPAIGENRGNLAAGGSGVVQAVTDVEYKIANELAPILQKKGLLFVGLDIIGDKLTEINVTSPTCVREIEKESGYPICKIFFDGIEQHISAKN